MITNSEKQVDLVLPLSLLGDVVEVSSLEIDYLNWKSSIPLSESSKKKAEEILLQYKDMGNISAKIIMI